ncbi:hypothetical protein STANM309S_00854 [Streptomyces tanashiensis]
MHGRPRPGRGPVARCPCTATRRPGHAPLPLRFRDTSSPPCSSPTTAPAGCPTCSPGCSARSAPCRTWSRPTPAAPTTPRSSSPTPSAPTASCTSPAAPASVAAVEEAARTAARLTPTTCPICKRPGGWDPVSRTWIDEAYDLPELPHGEPVQWLWLLHDDCAPEPGALAELLRVADSDSEAAVIGPKLRGWYDRKQLLEAGVSIARSGRRWTGLDRREQDQGQHDQVRSVLSVSTAGMLIRRDVFESLGGFDRRLPLMRDDVDLCWRAHSAGFRVLVAPDAVLRHAEASARERRTVDLAPGARPPTRTGSTRPAPSTPSWPTPAAERCRTSSCGSSSAPCSAPSPTSSARHRARRSTRSWASSRPCCAPRRSSPPASAARTRPSSTASSGPSPAARRHRPRHRRADRLPLRRRRGRHRRLPPRRRRVRPRRRRRRLPGDRAVRAAQEDRPQALDRSSSACSSSSPWSPAATSSPAARWPAAPCCPPPTPSPASGRGTPTRGTPSAPAAPRPPRPTSPPWRRRRGSSAPAPRRHAARTPSRPPLTGASPRGRSVPVLRDLGRHRVRSRPPTGAAAGRLRGRPVTSTSSPVRVAAHVNRRRAAAATLRRQASEQLQAHPVGSRSSPRPASRSEPYGDHGYPQGHETEQRPDGSSNQ